MIAQHLVQVTHPDYGLSCKTGRSNAFSGCRASGPSGVEKGAMTRYGLAVVRLVSDTCVPFLRVNITIARVWLRAKRYFRKGILVFYCSMRRLLFPRLWFDALFGISDNSIKFRCISA